MTKKRASALLVAATASVLTGCAGGQGQNSFGNTVSGAFDTSDSCSDADRNIGAIAGGVLGGVTAYFAKKNALITAAGTAVGAALGAWIGSAMDDRRCSLYKIAQTNNLKLTSTTLTPEKLGEPTQQGQGTSGDQSKTAIGLDVQLQNKDDEFVPGTAEITPAGRKYLTQIAQQYSPNETLKSLGPNPAPEAVQNTQDRKVLIVAHAEQTINSARAAEISQRRAKAVAELFAQAGVPTKNIYYQGAGDALPLASNADVAGRAANNRVEFVDFRSDDDLSRYLQLRAPNPSYFAAAEPPPSAGPVTSQPASPPKKHTHTKAQRPEAATGSTTNSQSTAPGAASPDDQAALSPSSPAPAPVAQATKAKATADSGYDFGGVPVTGLTDVIALVPTPSNSMFSFIATANAADPIQVRACVADAPHETTAVRNLATGEELPPRYFVPGFAKTVWVADANHNYISLAEATIPQDTGAPIPPPKLMIYKNYTGDKHAKPTYTATPHVNVYRGGDKTIYRVFVGGPAKCMDLVVASGKFDGTGSLYYDKDSSLYKATPAFSVLR